MADTAQEPTPRYSVVIPVFNSEAVIAETVRRTLAWFKQQGESCELVLVNDGSTDRSWDVVAEIARNNPHVLAIDLLHNRGQHAANLCGFRAARGAWLVTMDDDLQNPPEEIGKLIDKAAEGHDLVLGAFEKKRHAGHRRLGTRLVRALNRRIFGQEKDLVLSNFRLIRRDVVDRICAWRGPYPYVPGLCLMYSRQRANAAVRHDARKVGKSNYSLRRILSLVAAILFNYSSLPLRIVAGIGMFIALASFALGVFYLVRGLFFGSAVAGWTTMVVLLAFFNGIVITMLAMLGEYVVRIINQISSDDPYVVRERIGRD